uniref:EF-hand domain-containing protein n=1 Tax=Timema cristinae TaxID=61476 RepID=A0A7R9D4A8_TIMCR|nr:unnamed protein product [Timema cristinae]
MFAPSHVPVIRKAFQMFDTNKSGFIETLKISTILNTMGQLFDDNELQALIDETDPEGTGKVNFDGFTRIAAHFLEEEDAEAMQQELKEAFRLVHGDDDWRVKKPLGSNSVVLCFHLVANPGTWLKSNTNTSLRENIRLFNIITHIHQYTIENQGTPSSLTGTK